MRVQLFNKTILERAVNYLYPLEIKSVIVNEDKPAETSNLTLENDKNSNLRKAAIEARKKITNH